MSDENPEWTYDIIPDANANNDKPSLLNNLSQQLVATKEICRMDDETAEIELVC